MVVRSVVEGRAIRCLLLVGRRLQRRSEKDGRKFMGRRKPRSFRRLTTCCGVCVYGVKKGTTPRRSAAWAWSRCVSFTTHPIFSLVGPGGSEEVLGGGHGPTSTIGIRKEADGAYFRTSA